MHILYWVPICPTSYFPWESWICSSSAPWIINKMQTKVRGELTSHLHNGNSLYMCTDASVLPEPLCPDVWILQLRSKTMKVSALWQRCQVSNDQTTVRRFQTRWRTKKPPWLTASYFSIYTLVATNLCCQGFAVWCFFYLVPLCSI